MSSLYDDSGGDAIIDDNVEDGGYAGELDNCDGILGGDDVLMDVEGECILRRVT